MKNLGTIAAAPRAGGLRRALWIALAVISANLNPEFDSASNLSGIALSQQAEARGFVAARGVGVVDRGVARRTARRVSRRWAIGTQLTYLPSDCYWAGSNWYCEEDGVSFQQINENNTVIYVSL